MEFENLPVIDWDQAIRLAGNKKELAADILDLLMKGLPTEITSIHKAYQAQNPVELLKKVHKLHGALCYCGLPRVKIVIERLETDLKNNIMNDLPSHLAELDIEVNRLLEQYSYRNSYEQF